MSRGGGRRGAARGAAAAGGREWWHGLDGDDVISLEPLCELAYEPFSLPASGGEVGASVDAYNYFDGKILSRYLISSGNFVHPVSRRPLARAECERLDSYMQLHGLGNAGVTHVFDLKADTSGVCGEGRLLRCLSHGSLNTVYLNAPAPAPVRRLHFGTGYDGRPGRHQRLPRARMPQAIRT